MASENLQCLLLLPITLFWLGCASQKTQTTDHPPTSIDAPSFAEEHSTQLPIELHAAGASNDAESIAFLSGEPLKFNGPAGVAGQPAETKESTPQSNHPFFPAVTKKSMQSPVFPGSNFGPDTARSLNDERPLASLEQHSLPPENLVDSEFPGRAGEAGAPSIPLTSRPTPVVQPATSREDEISSTNSQSSLVVHNQRHEVPDTEHEKAQDEPPIAWPWMSPADTPKSIGGATESQPLGNLLAWLNKQNPAKPKNHNDELDDFSNPGKALAWLLGRAAPDGETASLSDARKQAAIMDWLFVLQQDSTTNPDAPAVDSDLAGVLDWFRREGGGAGDKPPNQTVLTGATQQLAHWLVQASDQGNGAGDSRESLGDNSNAMIEWLAQGRETLDLTNSSSSRSRDLKFPFRTTPGSSTTAEIDGKNIVTDGPFPFASLPKNNSLPSSNQSVPLRGKLHQWLQHPGTESAVVTKSRSNALQETVKYSAAFSWLLRGADFSKENRSTALPISSSQSVNHRPDLAAQEHVTEALRWFNKGSGQRRHRLHAATDAESETSSQTP
ncbi:MAG: hypothetical protein HN675_03295 [Opitutae bacterium]|nr:hypothetical protein [Opitutae bacterium]